MGKYTGLNQLKTEQTFLVFFSKYLIEEKAVWLDNIGEQNLALQTSTHVVSSTKRIPSFSSLSFLLDTDANSRVYDLFILLLFFFIRFSFSLSCFIKLHGHFCTCVNRHDAFSVSNIMLVELSLRRKAAIIMFSYFWNNWTGQVSNRNSIIYSQHLHRIILKTSLFSSSFLLLKSEILLETKKKKE